MRWRKEVDGLLCRTYGDALMQWQRHLKKKTPLACTPDLPTVVTAYAIYGYS